MRSLRTKFILVITFLILVVVGTNTFFVLSQKTNEISEDIFRNAVGFSQLVSSEVVDQYREIEETGAFLELPGAIKNLLELNFDVANVRIANFDGDVLYDFEQETVQRWDGDERRLSGDDMLDRVQFSIPSLKTVTGETVYFEQLESGEISYLNRQGQEVPGFNESSWIQNLVFPITGEEHFAVVYDIRYDTLQQRVWQTSETALYVAGASLLFGLLIAFFFTSGIVSPIKKLAATAVEIARGKFGHVIHVKSHDEVGHLAKSFNKMSLELKAATDELVARERIAKEVELASRIQEEFLPKTLPKTGGLDIHGGVSSAEAVGGDLYDFIETSKDSMLFYIGDVTGHGVSAGLVTAIANSLVYSLSKSKDADDVRKLSLYLNDVMAAKTRADMFITAFVGHWDAKTSKLSYTPCGHEPTYIFKQKSGKLVSLKKEGIALGMLADVDKILKKEEVKIEKGDVVIMYTDGIPEAWSKEKEMYGFERFEESIKKHGTKGSAKEIYEGLLDEVMQFMEGHEQMDDVTLVVMKKD